MVARVLEWLWWLCALFGALSIIVDMIWMDGPGDAWIALVWLCAAVAYRFLWQRKW
jgi:hypothetical protein